MDPATAAPRLTPEHSVSVAASSCMTADVAATTCFGLAPERAAELLRVQAAGARLVSHV